MMHTVLVWDDGYQEHEVDSPTPADVQSRITSLDGVNRTLVTLYRGGAHIAVGGSAQTGLVVYGTSDNETFLQLVGDSDSVESVAVVAGGQAGEYAARHIVTLEVALGAATTFAESGLFNPALHWEPA